MNLSPEYTQQDLSKACSQRGRPKSAITATQSKGENSSGKGSTMALQYTFDSTVSTSTFKGSVFYELHREIASFLFRIFVNCDSWSQFCFAYKNQSLPS